MKKILMTFVLCLSVLFANAQIATQNAKFFDNTYAGVEVGVSTPLNFNSVFPVNTVAGIKLGKEITPIVGVEIEGQLFFNDNNVGRWTNTFIKGSIVGANGTINVSNLLWGYKGTPRFFEVKTNTGLGWLRYWNTKGNDLTVKTAVDLVFNVGHTKAHSFVITPGVYWNLTGNNAKLQFNKNRAQLAIFASYVYHFRTSNGTRHFKTYDIGAMTDEIARLNEELAKKPTEVVVEKVVTKEVQVTNNTPVIIKDVCVFFAQNSAELSNEAKAILDGVSGTVDITAYASPEGSAKYNQTLSEKRAKVVADYLTSKGVKVASYTGLGCIDKTSNRVAIVSHE